MIKTGNAKPFVPIIIPFYSGSRYTREAIDNALAQNYSQNDINHASTDRRTDLKIFLRKM